MNVETCVAAVGWETHPMAKSRTPRRPNTLGPTGLQVAANIRRIRQLRGLSTTEMARRLTERGRPITAVAITNVEHGRRRVDVDDLVAFAAVLDVSPSALLLPPTAVGRVEVTGVGVVAAHDAWRWLDGQWPLGAPRDPEQLRRRLMDFFLMSRPEGIPPYHDVDRVVEWMRSFGETPFERDNEVPPE